MELPQKCSRKIQCEVYFCAQNFGVAVRVRSNRIMKMNHKKNVPTIKGTPSSVLHVAVGLRHKPVAFFQHSLRRRISSGMHRDAGINRIERSRPKRPQQR